LLPGSATVIGVKTQVRRRRRKADFNAKEMRGFPHPIGMSADSRKAAALRKSAHDERRTREEHG